MQECLFFSLFCTSCTAKVPCVDHHEHRYAARTRRQYHASAKYEGRQDSAPRINNPYIERRRTSWFTGVQMHVDVRAHQIKSVSLSHLKKTDGYVDRNRDAIDNIINEFQRVVFRVL